PLPGMTSSQRDLEFLWKATPTSSPTKRRSHTKLEVSGRCHVLWARISHKAMTSVHSHSSFLSQQENSALKLEAISPSLRLRSFPELCVKSMKSSSMKEACMF